MQITISTGTGSGPTSLAAFDAALIDAGVANHNLIYLSSVIPPGSHLRRAKYAANEHEYGNRLYVVMARHDETTPGRAAWAGIGWTQDAPSRRGLFVELHGTSRPQVAQDIQATLTAMVHARRQPYGAIDCEIAGIECYDQPVCALVVAVYQSVGWEG